MKNINIIYLTVLTLFGLVLFNGLSQEKKGSITGIITNKMTTQKFKVLP